MECDYRVMRLILLYGLWKWVPLQESPTFLKGDALTQLMPCDVTLPRSLGDREEMSVVRGVPAEEGVGASVVSFTDFLKKREFSHAANACWYLLCTRSSPWERDQGWAKQNPCSQGLCTSDGREMVTLMYTRTNTWKSKSGKCISQIL